MERLPAKFEDKREDFWVKNFAALNTQADRTAIADNEFAWLENVMPVGFANLKVVPYRDTALATLAASTINYWRYANINNVDYMMCFTVAGGATQIRLSDGAQTVIAVGGTFTGTVAMAQWKNERILIIASNGYWDWDGAVRTSRGGVTSAPSAGSTIATFAGRVWIGNGRTISYSAPNSFTDFQAASAGGSTIITDDTFKSSIYNLFSANNFLYVFGDSAVNVISDVRVSGATTLFSLVNVTAMFGTTMPLTVFPYFRTVSFGTPMGFYGLYGSTPQKVSDALDGIFDGIQFTNTISGGVAKIFNILCAAYLFQYADPVQGITRPLLALTFNKKWFLASQGSDLTLIAGGFLSGVPVLYGTNGTAIYKLFSDETSNIDWTIQTALWALKDPVSLKQTLKGGIEITSGAATTSVDVDVVSEIGTVGGSFSNTNTGEWQNAAGTEGQWQNAALEVGDWLFSSFSIYQANIEAFGRYIGYDISSSAPAARVNGLLMQHERKARWTGRT